MFVSSSEPVIARSTMPRPLLCKMFCEIRCPPPPSEQSQTPALTLRLIAFTAIVAAFVASAPAPRHSVEVMPKPDFTSPEASVGENLNCALPWMSLPKMFGWSLLAKRMPTELPIVSCFATGGGLRLAGGQGVGCGQGAPVNEALLKTSPPRMLLLTEV